MQLKILLIFCSILVASSTAQLATCFFGSRSIGGVSTYSCGFSIEGHSDDEISEIVGNHTAGMADENVLGVINIQGSTSFLPAVICSRFPNVQRVQFHGYGILEISDDSLRNCGNLQWLTIRSNPLTTVSEGAFVNLGQLNHLDLGSNIIRSLPDTVFGSLTNLQLLDIRHNPFTAIPASAFNGLVNLRTLLMQNTSVTSINPAWFENTQNIVMLQMYNNQITELTTESFSHLPSLETLHLQMNRIARIEAGSFHNSANITFLNMGSNSIAELSEGSFEGMRNLRTLQLMDNPVTRVGNRTFHGLVNLRFIRLENCRINTLEHDAFEGMEDLAELSLSSNHIEELPVGIFRHLRSLTFLGYSGNDLRFLRRDIFGDDLSALVNLDLNQNLVSAIERSVIEEAVSLNVLHFGNNVCESGTLSNFVTNRTMQMARLARCFRNFEFLVDTTTDSSPDYSFHPTDGSGISIRVHAHDTIHIALTPFDFSWSPTVEIIIGDANNTRSVIRRNLEADVVAMPTRNVLDSDQWNDFRVTWANHVVLVSKEGEMPFISFSMQDIFNVNFYGVKTVNSRATWSIVPVGF